jgi:hypothetical protein
VVDEWTFAIFHSSKLPGAVGSLSWRLASLACHEIRNAQGLAWLAVQAPMTQHKIWLKFGCHAKI